MESLLNKYLVLGSLAGGMDVGEVCEEYGLDGEDVLAAMDYAHRRISGEEVETLETGYFE